MSSTILYKFRASSTFEALPLPGSAARLFDVKKAIVKANKLDSGSMEFDLAVRNADTNEEYGDESMLLPRGTRIIVQRLPAARGQGFLARMARNEHGGGMGNSYHHQQQTPSGYYTIDNKTRENEEEEFVESSNDARAAENNDEKELAALRAVTSMQSDGPTMVGGRSAMMGGHRGGRNGPPQPAGMGGPPAGSKPSFNSMSNNNKPGGNTHFRPNADPELRDQEKKLMPKKRATGIPRTFLSLSAPPQTDGSKEGVEGEQQTPLLQPNRQGFKELVSRGGGQSESTAGTRRDLDYVLKLTSTTVPEHLKCAICNTVVKNPMLLPWDTEGRTVTETCIRDALTQNGFRCPLTGIDGVSPDDLIPNVGLRKAAEMFIKGVMEKVDEIEQQQVEEPENTTDYATERSSEKNVLDGEGAEKGVIVSKRMSLSNRKKSDDDPFGAGDNDFGGDVFAVEAKNEITDDPETATDKNEQENTDPSTGAAVGKESKSNGGDDSNSNEKSSKDNDADGNGNLSSSKIEPPNSKESNNIRNDETNERMTSRANSSTLQASNNDAHSAKASTERTLQKSPQPKPPPPPPTSSHMRFHRRRGPPVGYSMGPAGGAVVSARVNHQSNNNNSNNHQGSNNGQDHNNNYQGSNNGQDHNNNYQGSNNGQDHNNNYRGGRGGGRFPPRGGGRHGQYSQDRNGGGGYGRGRSGRGRGRGNNRFDGDQQDHQNIDDDDNSRGNKRGRDDQQQDEVGGDGQNHWDRNGRGNFRNEGGSGGRGSYGRGGGYRGGRGGRSRGGQQQQRGNYRGGGGRGNRSRY